MYYTIYQTTNKINGKIYIGMHETDNPNDGYLGSGKRLKRSIRYYGKEHFQKDVLFIFDNKEEMIQKEIELVTEEFINRKDTYNIALGGKGGEIYINSNQRIQNGKISGEIHKNKILTNESYRKEFLKTRTYKGLPNLIKSNSLGFKGKTHSEETKAKIKYTRHI